MTLVLDTGSEGPGVHALIIGVDDVSETGPTPLSAVLSAAELTLLLPRIDFADVPFASIELLAGKPRVPAAYRISGLPESEPPFLAAVQSAIRDWQARLDEHAENVAFFFFVGPILDYAKAIYLQLGEPGRARAGPYVRLVDLLNRIGECRARRQLYFIDGCWSIPAKERPDHATILHHEPPHQATLHADYVAHTRPGLSPTRADAGPVTGLVQAFLSLYSGGKAPVAATELGQRLQGAFMQKMHEMRLADSSEMNVYWTRDFELAGKAAVPPASDRRGSEQSASEQPAPAPAEEKRRSFGPTVKPGDVLGHHFQVTRFLGRGIMSEVFEGRNVNNDERVAIKVLPPTAAGDDKVIAKFGEEAATLIKLDHPALVKYQVLGRDPRRGLLYVVTAFIEGMDLASALGRLMPTADEIAGLLRRLASGLAVAHEQGVVHRAISPENIMLEGGIVQGAKLIDFDMAKDLDASWPTIAGDSVAAKLNYAAPEQIGSSGDEIGMWTDVYSLALVILAVAQGKDVDMGGSLRDALGKRLKGPDLSPAPPMLRPLLGAMLQADPQIRLRSMNEVLARLDAVAPPPEPAPHPLNLLNERQRECLRLVHQGMSTAAIAATLGISEVAAMRYIKTAMRIIGVSRRGEAAFYLVEAERQAAASQPPAIRDGGAGPAPRPHGVAGGEEPAAPVGDRQPTEEPNTHFVSDDPEVERDDLGRGPLAVALGRRLHRIWCRSNGVPMPGETVEAGGEDRAAFVLHLDAPWGGGKTSFANFLARVLNPFPAGCEGPAHFLAERAGGTNAVGTIFIDDPPAAGAADPAADWPEGGRRPWIVVPFNAWQAEHCAPPWWVFYQAIRKGCFNAVWAEGREASAAGQSTAPRRPSLARRIATWAGLWAREIGWRLRNPKIMALLGTAAVVGALILVLTLTGVIFSGGGGDGRAFNASDAFGSILIGVGGISGLWGLGALLTESVAPGTDTVAERKSLGGGDPFDRFRRHFGRIMKAVRRPVMVIVDDLDRCRPDFVVDLIRGIQTLLRSPRVVFVILGDRDWIERAFEAHHDAMKKVNVGAEQSFGARFVEKAIQMSFILPEMPETRQDGYVRRVLLGPGAAALGADAAPPPPADLSQQLRADYRETVASAETAEDRKEAEQLLRDKYQAEFQAAAQAGAEAAAPDAARPAIPDAETAGAQADKLLGEERAMLAAVDERMGKALLHRLEPLARAFPANPRQIKRIVNAITMYTCVAYLQMDMDETDGRGVELAIWVILMTEWPATWRLLAGCPDLLPAITAGKAADAKKALRAIDPTLLPGSAEATLEEIMRVRADPRLRALIEGDAAAGAPALTLASVREFRSLTPLYAGKRKLGAGPQSGETKH